MTSASKLLVAPGHNHWLPKLRARLQSKQPSAEVLVVEFQDSSGRIGFDLNASGQALFRNLVGGAHSWSPKKGHATQLGEQDATDYVRSLVVDGLSTPITLSKAAPDDAGSLRDLRTLEFLSSVDPDEQDDKFCEGVIPPFSAGIRSGKRSRGHRQLLHWRDAAERHVRSFIVVGPEPASRRVLDFLDRSEQRLR